MKRRVNRNPLIKRMRQEQAVERNNRRQALKPEEQLAILEARPGSSAREVARLKKQIKNES